MPRKFRAKMSALNPAPTTTMNRNSGTILATVAMLFSAAACLTPRRIMKCTPQSNREALSNATKVVPSPKTGKNLPRVALIRIRQATSARQQPAQ
ncbi:hypothetical protein D3C78_1308240 [compost metagenome]